MSTNEKTYLEESWHIEGGLAVLRHPYRDPVPYDLESLECALRDVALNRGEYATEQAYIRNVRLFETGIAMMKEHAKRNQT